MKKNKRKHFLNDSDGISAKDYMLIFSSSVFFIFVSAGLILLLMNKDLDPLYLDLIEIVSPVIITITSGIFGVKAVETFTNGRRRNEKGKRKYRVEEDEASYKESYEEDYNSGDYDQRI